MSVQVQTFSLYFGVNIVDLEVLAEISTWGCQLEEHLETEQNRTVKTSVTNLHVGVKK